MISILRRLLTAIGQEPYTFEGHWHSLTEVPDPTGFDAAFAKERASGIVKKPTLQSAMPLAVLVATTKPVTVIDFGGSAIQGYREILGMVYAPPPQYTLIELPVMCAALRGWFPDNQIVSRIPAKVALPCIVNVASSLQYVLNWRLALTDLAALKPDHFIIANTPLSHEETYARCQINGRNRRVPAWVFNGPELKESMKLLGYDMIYSRIHPEKYRHQGAPGPSWYATMIFKGDDHVSRS